MSDSQTKKQAKGSKSSNEAVAAHESKLKDDLGKELSLLLSEAYSSGKDHFQEFIGLTENLKAKQTELDIMSADSLPAPIISSYLSDVLMPNANGDLLSIVASDINVQPALDDIYKRLSIPPEKVVFSLLKNGIVIGEFQQAATVSVAKQVAATESVEAPAAEAVLVRKPGTILPNVAILSDSYTVFPILRYEKCIGFIEVRKDPAFLDSFDWKNGNLSYTDVIIHPVSDYIYETYGVRKSSSPLRLSVQQLDGSLLTYDIAAGASMLEDAYTAWKTLSLLQDSIVLASLIKNAQIMLVETEAGTATKQHVEAAKIKLRALFEGQIAMGQNGMKAYLSPQSKPAYIYSFTSNGVGKISTNLIGGEYNPGQLYYLTPFVNEFYSAMNYPKQLAGFTEGAGGLDGGGAVELYMLRYKAVVGKLKRLLGTFVKKSINNVLMSKGLTKLVDQFDVKVYGAFEETNQSEIQLKQLQLQLFTDVLTFSGIEDQARLKQVRAVMIKQIITDKIIVEALDKAMSEVAVPKVPASGATPEETDSVSWQDSQIPEAVDDELLPTSASADAAPDQSEGDQLPEMSEALSETA